MKSFGKLVLHSHPGRDRACVRFRSAARWTAGAGSPRDDKRDDRGDRHDDRDWHDDRGNHRGPPPHARSWQRGHRYDGRVIIVNDYRVRHLREPPRGYHWVRDDDS